MSANENSKSLDVFGAKPIADAALVITKGGVEGASAFLSRICLPAAEEFGLLLKDRVSSWRQAQALSILKKAEKKNAARENSENLRVHPRLAMLAIEQGSWTDDTNLQDMWAGLLSSACSISGSADGNLIFMNILAQLTAGEALAINYACELSEKYRTKGGFIQAFPVWESNGRACEIMGSKDVHFIDFQLDHLREIGLMPNGSGIHASTGDVAFWPSALALALYVRAQGSAASPSEFFTGWKNESDYADFELELKHTLPNQ